MEWRCDGAGMAAPKRAAIPCGLPAYPRADSRGAQGSADPIRFRKVLDGTRLAPRRQQRLDLAVRQALDSSAALQIVVGVLLQNPQYRAQCAQRRSRVRRSRRIAGGLGKIEIPRDPLHHGKRLRRVEIIVHGAAKSLDFSGIHHALRRRVLQRPVQAQQGLIRLRELRRGIVDGTAIVAAQQEEPQYFRIAQRLQHFAHGEEIAERFRHLLIIDADEAVVHPHMHEGRIAGRARLRDLVFMMRKFQILAAAVQVEVVPQQAGRHRGTFDVPARPAVAPGRGPGGLARFRMLPQHEVERIVLGLVDLHARAGAQIVDLLARKPAVVRELAHRVHHVAVVGGIGKALVDQGLQSWQ